MPKGKTKKFIDKKNSVTFQLVHRSQRDPLIADEDAPERVFMPVEDPQSAKHLKSHIEKQQKLGFAEKRKQEQEKYGIFFSDGYDYMQHLRSVEHSVEWERIENPNGHKKETAKINLPPTVLESEEQEEVGLLNRAIPMGLRLDLDPDVVAAMDEDFDFDNPDNELEDDFISLAGGIVKEGKLDEDEDGYDFDEECDEESESEYDSSGHMEVSDEDDDLGSLKDKQFAFKKEETKSRFSDYSMTSSVMRRNEQLSLLDERFEKLYAEYDDNEIGALDCEEIEGNIDIDADNLLKHVDKFKKNQMEYLEETKDITRLMKDRMNIIEQEDSGSENEQALEKLVVEARERNKWDCESILSTYSNIYNHPKLISEPKGPGKIKIDRKTGIPKNVLNDFPDKLTAKSLAQFDLLNEKGMQRGPLSVAETMKSIVSELSVRPKDETPEERKERKQMLKEYRRERRIERKANTEAFKEEKKRQEKIMLNNKKNIQGNRIV